MNNPSAASALAPVSAPATATATVPSPTNTRKPRPNYRHIHRFPLPIEAHPLPPLIPHNPLSILSIFVAYLSQVIYPPRRTVYSAYFDAASGSVQVTDAVAVRALWEMGFFGKGSLSRSEPTWLDRERVRRGTAADLRSEHITAKRRDERKEWKLERARKEREAIAHQLKTEEEARRLAGVTTDEKSRGPTEVAQGQPLESSNSSEVKYIQSHATEEIAETATALGAVTSDNPDDSNSIANMKRPSAPFADNNNHREQLSSADTHENHDASTTSAAIEIVNEEHLQLSLEEAFFLAYGLGVLHVYDGARPDAELLPPTILLSLFRQHSTSSPNSLSPTPSTPPQPDDPFLLSYVVYHHFRSLGWIVRSGVKFGTDYLLYNRGPVFSHAEFAVVILPAYSHPDWATPPGTTGHDLDHQRRCRANHPRKTWWWLHCVNRVQAQVKKSLVLAYVDVPPVSSSSSSSRDDNIGALLGRYKVREFTIRRWVPNRMRD